MISIFTARGILKKKLLLPVLLLLKLKMKALMPILVAIIGIKAIKALILSKLAITLVLGFLIYNLVMKKGGKLKLELKTFGSIKKIVYKNPLHFILQK